jgi:TonB family protein
MGMRAIQRAFLIAAGTALCASSSSAAPKPLVPRQPTGPWVVDYSQDECILDRNYGTASQPQVLAISRVPMDTRVTLSYVTRDQKPLLRDGKAKIGFGTAAPVEAGFRAYPVAGKAVRNLAAYVADGVRSIESAADAGVISIDAAGELRQAYAVPGLAAAVRALDACVLDLGKAWGISIDQQKRLKEPARPLSDQYLSPDDYPPNTLNENITGRAQVRMWVDETGKPLDCTPLRSSGSPVFGETSCRLLMKRAAFKPAVDVDGKPVRSIYIYTVDWLVSG